MGRIRLFIGHSTSIRLGLNIITSIRVACSRNISRSSRSSPTRSTQNPRSSTPVICAVVLALILIVALTSIEILVLVVVPSTYTT